MNPIAADFRLSANTGAIALLEGVLRTQISGARRPKNGPGTFIAGTGKIDPHRYVTRRQIGKKLTPMWVP